MQKQQRVRGLFREEAFPPANAKILIQRGWRMGRVHATPHFQRRARERGFTLIDAGHAIQRGVIYEPPEFCVRFRNWKYRIERKPSRGEESFGVVVALEVDDPSAPLVILITGYRVQ